MKSKRLFINIVSNVLSFLIQLVISFTLTPIIVEKIGDAAYGFVGLANNFTSYASLITIVINSMAGRFITLELSKNNIEKANKYYNSVFIMDIVMTSIIALSSVFIIIFLNNIINIPNNILFDVRLTFGLSFINLIISVMSTVFTISTFAKNRLELSAIRNIVGNIIKALLLIVFFILLKPKIFYIALIGLISTVYYFIANLKLTSKLTPELKINKKNFDFACIKILTKSGIWNLINNFGKILLTGLDLLIANLFVGPDAMGFISISKTVPNSVEGLLATIAGTFNPQLIILYSKNKIKELVNTIKFAERLIALLLNVPIAGFIALGTSFFSLWLPNKSADEIILLQQLSVLALLPFSFSVGNYPLFLLDSVTNKLKRPVIMTFVIGVLSTIVTFILLNTTELGIYAIAGVSSIFWALKVLIFNNINAAINLRIKWYTFFGIYLKNICGLICTLISFMFLKNYVIIENWTDFIIVAAMFGLIGYVINTLIIVNKSDFVIIKEKIYNRIKVKKYTST